MIRSRWLYILFTTLFFISGSFGSAFWSGNVCEASDNIVLKMNHQFPENTAGSKIDKWFAEQIKKETNGRISIRIFWSNGLGKPRDNLSLLARGAIDMAGMSAGYFPDEMPLLAAPNSIPMAMDDVCQASLIMKAFLERIPDIHKEAADLGIRPIFFHVLNPYLLVSKRPVTQLSDLQGMRIRTWGNEMAELVRSVGGKPVPLFLPDLNDAFKHDIIDGCPFSVDLTLSYNIHKLARHITEVTLWEGPSWGVWIGTETWNRLSVDEQTIFIETAEKARKKDISMARKSGHEARQVLIDKGIEFHPFPESQTIEWKQKSPDYFSRFIDQMERQGKGRAAKQMVDIWQKIRKHNRCTENGE